MEKFIVITCEGCDKVFMCEVSNISDIDEHYVCPKCGELMSSHRGGFVEVDVNSVHYGINM